MLLEFIAPIASGNEVVIFFMSRLLPGMFADTEEKTRVVLDRSSGILYCDERVIGLRFDGSSIDDPPALFADAGWKVDEQRIGRVRCAVVSFSAAEVGGASVGRTRLFLFDAASESTPFRS
jgi:hypothetical protein